MFKNHFSRVRPHLLCRLLVLLLLPGCARNVNDYLAEARSNEPGAVKDAVVTIGGILQQKQAQNLPLTRADGEAILYLEDVASRDPVPINRVVALRALGRLRGVGKSEVFLAALDDSFWLARWEAIEGIRGLQEESFAGPLRELLETEKQPEVRLAIVKALRAIKGPLALKTLLEVFLQRTGGARDPQFQAYLAIQEMTGLLYGFEDVQTWENYYQEKYGKTGEQGSAGEEGATG